MYCGEPTVIPWVTSTLSDPSVGIYSITLQILRVGTSPTPINAPHHQHQPLSTQFLPIFRPFSRPFIHVPPRSHLLHSTHCHSGRCDSPLGLTLRSYSGTRTDHHCRGPAAPAVLLDCVRPPYTNEVPPFRAYILARTGGDPSRRAITG